MTRPYGSITPPFNLPRRAAGFVAERPDRPGYRALYWHDGTLSCTFSRWDTLNTIAQALDVVGTHRLSPEGWVYVVRGRIPAAGPGSAYA